MDKNSATIVQEDLGLVSLYEYVLLANNKKITYWYKKAISLLLNIQRLDKDFFSNFRRDLDQHHLHREFEDLVIPWVINSNLEFDFPPGFITTTVPKLYRRIEEILGNSNLMPCHRDFQSTNLFLKNGRIYCIDFLGARNAPPEYDLASLLGDCNVNLSQDLKTELLNFYWSNFVKIFGGLMSKQSFLQEYQSALCQRMLHDSAIFARSFHETGQKRFQRLLKKSLHTVYFASKELI